MSITTVKKEKQFIIAMFDTGKCVKFDLNKNEVIGISGNPIKGHATYLREHSFGDFMSHLETNDPVTVTLLLRAYIIEKGNVCARDGQYKDIINIGSIFRKISEIAFLEKFFAVGIYAGYRINDMTPAGLRKSDIEHLRQYIGCPDIVEIANAHNLNTMDEAIVYLKEHFDDYSSNQLLRILLGMSYFNLADKEKAIIDTVDPDTICIMINRRALIMDDAANKIMEDEIAPCSYYNAICQKLVELQNNYGVPAKKVLEFGGYLYNIERYYVIDDGYGSDLVRRPFHRCLRRYMEEIDFYLKYRPYADYETKQLPKNFPVEYHKMRHVAEIALSTKKEEMFLTRRNPAYETTIDGYAFITPKDIADFNREAELQCHCLSGYLSNFISGECYIIFMRKVATPDQPCVTLELRKGNNGQMRVVQARKKHNNNPDNKDQKALDKYNEFLKTL